MFGEMVISPLRIFGGVAVQTRVGTQHVSIGWGEGVGPATGKAWPKPGGAEFARVASERTGGGDRGGAYVPQAKAAGAGGGAESRGQMTRRRSRYFLDPPAGAAAAPCAGAGNLRPPPCPTRPASKVTAPRGQGLPGGGGPERWRRRRR